VAASTWEDAPVNDAGVLARISELGLELPAPPQAVAAYIPVVVAGSLAFVAGQIPIVEGTLQHPGVVGDDVTVEDATGDAARCALQALSALRGELGSFERLRRIVQVSVFVAAAEGFTQHPAVANGASELLGDVLGDEGRHARAAVGVPSLPLGACVEVAMTAEVEPS
jgi:enamine deaminase RidA (YjgF/YER057c/UK114 family)